MKKFLIILGLTLIAAAAAVAQTGEKSGEITEIVYEGKTFHKGDRVKVTSFAGTVKPDESGYAKELVAGAGIVGTVVRGEKRQATSYFEPEPNEPIQIAVVKWDAQKWQIDNKTKSPVIKSFESTIHISYLEVIPQPTAKKKKGKK